MAKDMYEFTSELKSIVVSAELNHDYAFKIEPYDFFRAANAREMLCLLQLNFNVYIDVRASTVQKMFNALGIYSVRNQVSTNERYLLLRQITDYALYNKVDLQLFDTLYENGFDNECNLMKYALAHRYVDTYIGTLLWMQKNLMQDIFVFENITHHIITLQIAYGASAALKRTLFFEYMTHMSSSNDTRSDVVVIDHKTLTLKQLFYIHCACHRIHFSRYGLDNTSHDALTAWFHTHNGKSLCVVNLRCASSSSVFKSSNYELSMNIPKMKNSQKSEMQSIYRGICELLTAAENRLYCMRCDLIDNSTNSAVNFMFDSFHGKLQFDCVSPEMQMIVLNDLMRRRAPHQLKPTENSTFEILDENCLFDRLVSNTSEDYTEISRLLRQTFCEDFLLWVVERPTQRRLISDSS